jgi:hypothetical protein
MGDAHSQHRPNQDSATERAGHLDVEGAVDVAEVSGDNPDDAAGDVHHGHLYAHQFKGEVEQLKLNDVLTE